MGCKRKTRPRSRRERKTGVSPYARHGKTEYKYAHQSGRKRPAREG